MWGVLEKHAFKARPFGPDWAHGKAAGKCFFRPPTPGVEMVQAINPHQEQKLFRCGPRAIETGIPLENSLVLGLPLPQVGPCFQGRIGLSQTTQLDWFLWGTESCLGRPDGIASGWPHRSHKKRRSFSISCKSQPGPVWCCIQQSIY